ncbi:CobW family GTP-binding protein [Phytohabitans kaempferiae]|uniref:CobW family GTP-binding protein n=1 Tax=Phytohabitans kaempferiae TaxID=1620943 RepID=A0ABV6MAY8_9ACTN
MSSRAQARGVDVGADTRPAVTVLSGFWPAVTFAAARALLAADPSLLLVRHDIREVRDGAVRRVVRTGSGVLEDERVTLVHGCGACTLREDVLPTLVRLAGAHPGRDIVLVLPEALEPEALATACAHCLVDGAPVTEAVRFDSYVTVVDAAGLMAGLTSTDDLSRRGLHAADSDHRAVADVVARQIEYADTVVLWGHSTADTFETARLAVLLDRLAPWAAHFAVVESTVDCTGLADRLRHTGRHRPETPAVLARGIEGYALGVHEPVPDCGVVSTVFRARRPFHPERLHRALGAVTAPALRSRGHLWLASQPDTVVAWEAAGAGLSMGSLGPWLAALPDDRWNDASDLRKLAAAMEWDPYYGDRHTHLVTIGVGLDAADLHRFLTACLLTDAELAAGEEAWRGWPDPFAGVLAPRSDR